LIDVLNAPGIGRRRYLMSTARTESPKTESQLPLPLPLEGWDEEALRSAHRSARLKIPFEVAMRDRALAICLRCLSEARLASRRKHQQRAASVAARDQDLFALT